MTGARRFRHKPTVIEAVRWTGDNEADLIAFAGPRFTAVEPGEPIGGPEISARIYDDLHRTWIGVRTGHWIAKGTKGEFWPIDDLVLPETYDPVLEPDDAPASPLQPAAHQEQAGHGDGQWKVIAFFGHAEYTGWVTEITRHGQAAYRIDLPEKIWGGNPLAYVTHAASSWFSDHPVAEESVRAAWEAQLERARLRAEQEAEWLRAQEQPAIGPAATDYDDHTEGAPF